MTASEGDWSGDEEQIMSEGSERARGGSTVLDTTDDDVGCGKMPLPYRGKPFYLALPVTGEGPSLTPSELIRGRPPKQLKTIPKSAFKYYQMRLDKKPYKVRPDLLELRNQYLTEVTGIERYFHIYYLDLTYNKITNEGLSTLRFMQNLITLILDHNKLLSTIIPILKHLEYLSLNKNLLRKINKFDQPNLMHVYLNENKIKRIQNVDSSSLPELYTLSISRCLIRSMSSDYSPTLRRLYLSYNKITSINSLKHLVNLEVLHLRANQIQNLSGLSSTLKKLFYINLRENEIAEEKQLKRINVLPLLRVFILSENPIEDILGTDLRNKILQQIPDMRRINKFLVDDEEELLARQQIQERRLAEEKRRERFERLRELGEIDMAAEGEIDKLYFEYD